MTSHSDLRFSSLAFSQNENKKSQQAGTDSPTDTKGVIKDPWVLLFFALWDVRAGNEAIILAEDEDSNGLDVSWHVGGVKKPQQTQ